MTSCNQLEVKISAKIPEIFAGQSSGQSCCSTKCETVGRQSQDHHRLYDTKSVPRSCMPQNIPVERLNDKKIFATCSNLPLSQGCEDHSSKSFFDQMIGISRKLAGLFEGSVLSDKTFSICKSMESVKFRCQNGHVFYKQVDQLKACLKNATGRKISVSTAASMSTSSDEESLDAAHQYGCWCPKCEEFYSICKTVGKNSGFKLEGRCYAKTLSFICSGSNHLMPIYYNKKVSQILSCTDCKRE